MNDPAPANGSAPDFREERFTSNPSEDLAQVSLTAERPPDQARVPQLVTDHPREFGFLFKYPTRAEAAAVAQEAAKVVSEAVTAWYDQKFNGKAESPYPPADWWKPRDETFGGGPQEYEYSCYVKSGVFETFEATPAGLMSWYYAVVDYPSIEIFEEFSRRNGYVMVDQDGCPSGLWSEMYNADCEAGEVNLQLTHKTVYHLEYDSFQTVKHPVSRKGDLVTIAARSTMPKPLPPGIPEDE